MERCNRLANGMIGLWMLMASLSLGGQELRWDRWTVEDGLSNNKVTTIHQDQFGWIWIATGHGLTSYNGYEFAVHRYHPFDSTSIGANYVEEVFETGHGDIWAALSVGGVSRLDRANMSFRSYQSQWMSDAQLHQANLFVRTLLQDSQGEVWLGTRAGLNKINEATASFDRIWPQGEEEQIIIHHIHDFAPHRLLLGTEQGFFVFDTHTAKAYRPAIHWQDTSWVNNYAIEHILADAQERIWLGSRGGGVFLWDHQQDRLLPQWDKVDPKASGPQYCLQLMQSGEQVWASFRKYGLRQIWPADSLVANGVSATTIRWALHMDENGTWGLNSQGELVHLKTGASNKGIKGELGLAELDFHTTLLAKDGALWFSHRAGGIGRAYIAAPVAQKYRPPIDGGEALQQVSAMLTDASGSLWFANPRGLFCQDTRDREVKHWAFSADQIPGHVIFGLAEDGEGQIWIATNDGLACLSQATTKIRRYQPNREDPHALRTGFIRGVNTDRLGRVWVGTSIGLHLYRPQTDDFRRFFKEDHPHSLSGNDVRIILEADTNIYWIGKVRTGLNRMTYFPAQDSISCEAFYFRGSHHFSDSLMTVNSLTLDRKGELWLGTFSDGLLRFDRRQQALVSVFEEETPVSRITAMQEDEEGYLWMGSNEGLYRYHHREQLLQQFLQTDGVPSPQFHIGSSTSDRAGRLYFGGIKEVMYVEPKTDFKPTPLAPPQIVNIQKYGKKMSFEQPIQYLDQLHLSADDSFFSIHFLSVNFQTKQGLQYRYRLEGLQEEWIELGEQRSVSFSHLPGGSYLFRVAVGDRRGYWSAEEAVLAIEVAFPFHQTKLFYGLILGLIILLAWGSYALRWYFQRRKLATLATVREKAAADFHDELGHRLTKISLFTERIIHQNPKLDGDTHQYLQKIKNNAGELYHSMRDFLWAMNPQKDALLELAILLKDFGDDLFSHTSIAFWVEGIESLPKDVFLSMDWKRQLVLIFKEAMHNSLKHAHCTQLCLRFEFEDGILKIELEDNGQGFMQTPEQQGYGLRNMRQRALRINSQLTISSPLQGGTRISFMGYIQKSQLWTKSKAFK